MSDFSEEKIESIWQKGREVKGLDASKYRLDAAGALMARAKYGDKEHMYGWEVDHIYPKARLEELGVNEDLWDHHLNLQPLNVKNNESKSDDYPVYTASCEYDGEKRMNCGVSKMVQVRKALQTLLPVLFRLVKVQSK